MSTIDGQIGGLEQGEKYFLLGTQIFTNPGGEFVTDLRTQEGGVDMDSDLRRYHIEKVHQLPLPDDLDLVRRYNHLGREGLC